MKLSFKVFVLFVFFTQFANSEVVEKIVAVVNNEIVLESDFPLLVSKIKKRVLDENLLPENQSAFLNFDRHSLLQYMINERLLDSEVKRLNLNVTDEKVDQKIRDIAKSNRITAEEVLATVQQEGVSVEEYKSTLKSQIERQSLIENEVISRLRISDEDALSEYLKTNPSSKISVNEFSISHIFFNPKKGSPMDAYKRAEDVLLRLKQGESFELLAEQNSEDPNFSKGGYLGSFKSGEFMPEVEQSISDMNPGQYSGIIKSRMGFHIVKLISKSVSPDPKFEKEKEKIKNHIFSQTFRRQLRLWLETKREEAFIKINEAP